MINIDHFELTRVNMKVFEKFHRYAMIGVKNIEYFLFHITEKSNI